MSLWARLFGDHSEVAWLRGRIEKLEDINAALRGEVISLTNAGARAQIEAYREKLHDEVETRRKARAMPEEREVVMPPDITDSPYIMDFAIDGHIPPDMIPTEEEVAAEAARRYREDARARGVPSGHPQEPD